MQPTTSDGCQCVAHAPETLGRLRHAIDHAAHLLPAQGPITVFIHHNTLHAFEDRPFHEAVQHGGTVFGCAPYLSEQRYMAELARGRIRFDDLRGVLEEELGGRAQDSLVGLATCLDLRLTMLARPVWSGPLPELHWIVAETDALRRVRPGVSDQARGRLLTATRHWVMRDLRVHARRAPGWTTELFRQFPVTSIESWEESTWEAFALEALWRVCQDGVRGLPAPAPADAPRLRHRDLLHEVAAVDADALVHEPLIRLCAAFLDQGMSHWQLPERERGLYPSFLDMYGQAGGPPDAWMRGLRAEATRQRAAGMTALDSVAESLELLGVPEEEWDDYLSQTLLALRGWAGMVAQIAERGDRVPHPIPRHSLHDYLAVRLLLDRLALAYVARTELDYTGPLRALRDELRGRLPRPAPLSTAQRAFPLFHLAQDLGWSPEELYRLTPGEWALLVGEVESFSELERRRVFHLAYERRFRIQCLDAVALYPGYTTLAEKRPRFQTIHCLDEREESVRRHIEEVAPDAETFSTAGFYYVAMYYRGAADAHFVPLCPIVITPQHWVQEKVCDGNEQTHERRSLTRRTMGRVAHGFDVGTRTFALGALITAGLGVLASIPLVAGVFCPRLLARLRHRFAHLTRPPSTRLNLERAEATTGAAHGHQGFSLEEMISITSKVLLDTGLTRRFARLVFSLGHGSESLNNPHESAHDCGACGGGRGGPNGRAFATMVNDPRVRAGLAQQGVVIPQDTHFVGGYHNTCDDSVTLFDTDRVPDTHRAEFQAAVKDIDEARRRDAHERCRRFESAPLSLSEEAALAHVEARTDDLSQVRPEYGHATNALCIVGRRDRTRGLYLDRRAFLTSYDPTQDDDKGSTLARILSAVVPVCAGISLEYYFSHVDSAGYGCDTKLPHNITSFLGVMDGAASDLRTGLPWQMVEIHEPVRLLFIIETTPEKFLHIMNNSPVITRLVRLGWVQMAVLSPTSNEVQLFCNDAFRPYEPEATNLPTAPTSVDWYRGWRDHLEFAQITD